MSKIYDVVAVVGKRANDKPNYVKVGAVFKSEKGMSMKLDAIPAGSEWNGWLNFYEPKPRGESAPSSEPPPDFDDRVPF